MLSEVQYFAEIGMLVSGFSIIVNDFYYDGTDQS